MYIYSVYVCYSNSFFIVQSTLPPVKRPKRYTYTPIRSYFHLFIPMYILSFVQSIRQKPGMFRKCNHILHPIFNVFQLNVYVSYICRDHF